MGAGERKLTFQIAGSCSPKSLAANAHTCLYFSFCHILTAQVQRKQTLAGQQIHVTVTDKAS